MDKKDIELAGYKYRDNRFTCAHDFILPTLIKILKSKKGNGNSSRIFEMGCGNGAVANRIREIGFEVIGIDSSEEGIEIANRAYPNIELFRRSVYDDLVGEFGTFDIVYSLEVVEHLFFPRTFAENLFAICNPGGTAILSTPYHGYFKNLALSLTGTMDRHFTALWDYGHIKFWSMKTISKLLREAGFGSISFFRVGRIPPLAKSMIVVARKPS